MSTARVFGLRKVYINQVKNITDNNFASWPEGATYGYFAGGDVPAITSPGGTSIITRLDFFNETLSDPGNNLPALLNSSRSVLNTLYGYIGASYSSTIGSRINTITRLDFSNETLSDPGKNLPTARTGSASVSNTLYGYYGGGDEGPPSSPPLLSTITRLDFSNETLSDLENKLPMGISRGAAVSTNYYGYFGGGNSFTGSFPLKDTSEISRLDFSTENISLPGKNLPIPTIQQSTVSSTSYGYFGGGSPGLAGPVYLSKFDRIDFSNETITNPGKIMATDRNLPGSVQTNTYGYFSGGNDPPNSRLTSSSRLDFSTENVTVGSSLPSGRTNMGGLSGGTSFYRGSKTYGYYGGGEDGTNTINTITRLDFSSETVSDPGNNLPTARDGLSATSSNSYGYFGRGNTPPYINTITRLDFSNETVSDPGKNLPGAPAFAAGAATSSNSYGYYAGGYNFPPQQYFSTISRLDFSNETVHNPGKNLPNARAFLSAVSSNSYGYFAGGITPPSMNPPINTITRLDFSNETVSDPGNNLPFGVRFLSGVSSGSYGYFGGGNTPNLISTITRLDFSNETVSEPGNNLPTERTSSAVTSNNFYGYFGGGFTPSTPPIISTISRLDFSSETASDSGNNLPTARSRSEAVSNSN